MGRLVDLGVNREFAELISRHREVVVLLRQSKLGPEFDPFEHATISSAEEMMLRTRIIAWVPANRAEAYKKLEHLVQALASGVPIDKIAVDLALKSVEVFFPNA